MTATSTWTPDNPADTSPAPQVIVTQVADASWTVRGSDYPTASCADGFGDSEVDTTFFGGYYYVGDSGRTNYSLQSPSGNTVTVTCSGVSATLDYNSTTPPVNDGDVSASWGVMLSPVTIGFVGATLGQGGWDVLVGQDVGPFLIGIPNACTISNYQWTVTGTTMQSWKVSSDSTHTTEVDGSGPLNTAEADWFWNDPQQATETVTCTATVTPPARQGAPFSVTATQDVGVYLPVLTAKALGGQMTVDVNEPGSKNSADFWLHAAPSSCSTQPGGMTWQVDLAPPQNAPVAFEQGNIYLMQTITPDVNFINTTNQEYESIFQGQLGLDTLWPYGWAVYENDADQPDYVSYDSPGMDLTALNAIYGAEESSFEDYIMYQPYGPSEYVPLANFKWNINGTVTIPSTNNWADYRNPDGIIEPSGAPVKFTMNNTYPSWTQNSGNVADNAIAFKPF